MQPSPENNEQKLERFLHQTLRDLPPRRAPRTLEQRVFAELERRAALPWWHKSYAHWPLVVRCAFLLASAGIMKAALMATVWVMVGFESAAFSDAFASQFELLHVLGALGDSIFDFGRDLVLSIPPLWLYGGLACIAAMNATLFGVGAFAYRTFFANRQVSFK